MCTVHTQLLPHRNVYMNMYVSVSWKELHARYTDLTNIMSRNWCAVTLYSVTVTGFDCAQGNGFPMAVLAAANFTNNCKLSNIDAIQ